MVSIPRKVLLFCILHESDGVGYVSVGTCKPIYSNMVLCLVVRSISSMCKTIRVSLYPICLGTIYETRKKMVLSSFIVMSDMISGITSLQLLHHTITSVLLPFYFKTVTMISFDAKLHLLLPKTKTPFLRNDLVDNLQMMLA